MMKPTLIEAVQSLTDQGFGWDGGEDAIVWPESNTGDAPSRADIDAELVELLADWTAKQYQRDRAKAYDSVGNQLDQIMKDKRDGTTTHQTACEAVKATYPKG